MYNLKDSCGSGLESACAPPDRTSVGTVLADLGLRLRGVGFGISGAGCKACRGVGLKDQDSRTRLGGLLTKSVRELSAQMFAPLLDPPTTSDSIFYPKYLLLRTRRALFKGYWGGLNGTL